MLHKTPKVKGKLAELGNSVPRLVSSSSQLAPKGRAPCTDSNITGNKRRSFRGSPAEVMPSTDEPFYTWAIETLCYTSVIEQHWGYGNT